MYKQNIRAGISYKGQTKVLQLPQMSQNLCLLIPFYEQFEFLNEMS